jgi:hypothetical protein
MLHQALGVSAQLVEQGADSIARIADAVAAVPQALQAMADRRAAQARQAEQERAARQQEIAAGVSRFRDRYGDRRRQETEAARIDLARRAVAPWEDLIRAHHAALPGISNDPALEGTGDQLIEFARALNRTPEVVHALRTRGPELGMEARPKLARVLADESTERAVIALLDAVLERQHAALTADAEHKAALLRPGCAPGPRPRGCSV